MVNRLRQIPERLRAIPRATVIALVVLAIPALFFACSERLGGGSVYVYDEETKQPLANVSVVLYVSSARANLLPFMHSGSSGQCDSDFVGISDANGLVEVPFNSLWVLWAPSLDERSPIFRGTAYLKGYYDVMKKLEGIRSAGNNARKSGPLRVEFAMAKELGSMADRVNYLVGISTSGCSCSTFDERIASELKEISPVAAREDGLRAMRGERRKFGSGIPGPMKLCK